MNKKYLSSLVMIMFLAGTIVAQNSKVASAKLAYDDATSVMAGSDMESLPQEDLEKIKSKLTAAVGYIEPATTHEKTAIKEKTWRYRGDIYQLLSRFLEKPGFSDISPNPVELGAESYMKALDLDTKGSYEKENTLGLSIMQNISVNSGINLYNVEDYAGAYKHFDSANMMADKMGIVDSTAIFNAGLSADRAGDNTNAMMYYRKAIDMKFPDPSLYKFLYDVTVKGGDKEQALKVLKEGRVAHPNDQGLLIDEVNVYLEDDNLEEALSNLEMSLKNDPDNSVLNYSAGSVYDNLGKMPEARAAYDKAISLNPDYFEANYNLGASYYNEAAAIIKDVNQMSLSQSKEMAVGTEKANGLFNMAMPFLEKAHELDAEDASTVQSLKEIYVRLKMTDKYKSLK
ncbi:MAG: tetratricopeptide (TPR) repeat protein [Patiriisocius sp.]|jgi:tetratricopeptide (TPR) repeat protein